MLRNISNFRNFCNLFSFRGVINSDTPKWVSRFVTPLQGVSRFATPFTSAVACHHYFPIPASAEWQYD